MFRRLSVKRAQTTLEYAILIGVIVAGLIAMQVYLKRGFQGKLKESADTMGQQFSPDYTTSHYTTKSSTDSEETLSNEVTTTKINKQESAKTGNEDVSGSDQEKLWK